MTEEKPAKPPQEGLDYSGRPFGYVAPESETVMICEQDPVIREKISNNLKKMGFEIVQPATSKEALRYMRFHIFDIIFIDEDFDTGVWESNRILKYLEGLNMSIRREIFVVLVSTTLTTLDNMQAYNKSVNLIVNKREMGGIEQLLRQSLIEYDDFYHTFKDKIHKFGIT
jgi:CheY-like chemotaxis protein